MDTDVVSQEDSAAEDLGCQCSVDEDCLAPIGGECAGAARCIACLCTVESADSNPCTPDDLCQLPGTCMNGLCVSSGPKPCDDGDDCTADSCDPASGCQTVPIPDCPPVVCGDGTCSDSESCKKCPKDCGECPVVCGDGQCGGEEDCESCQDDCGQCPLRCGDGECDQEDESCKSCPQDCGQCPIICGDGECNGDETCKSCVDDCGDCPVVCGDSECTGDETCKSCQADCGACPIVCGDGACNGDETCKSCVDDCGDCPPGCGDGLCDGGETCETCSLDCGQCAPVCGDTKCNGDETVVTCHADCAPQWLVKGDPLSHGTVFQKGPAACQACHTPTLDGGAGSCETCHPGWKSNCTFCHGGKDNQTGAPPEGVGGETSPSSLSVGAHTKHVTATSLKGAYGCASCHSPATDALSEGHVDGDGKAETTIVACGLAASYAAGTCSSVYCHGNGKSAASGGTASWTGGPMTCDSCHSTAGLGGKHKTHLGFGMTCDNCHGDTVSANGTISNPDKHLNCVKDVKGDYDFAPQTKTCSSNSCHEDASW